MSARWLSVVIGSMLAVPLVATYTLSSPAVPAAASTLAQPTEAAATLEALALLDANADNFVFTYAGETATVTGYRGSSSDISIPEVVWKDGNSYTVSGIAERAFQYNGGTLSRKLTSVVIPGSVTTIGDSAFASNSLTSVGIPGSVTAIGDGAFASNSLTNVGIPGSVTTIGDWSFYQNSLTSLVLPDSLTSVGIYAFASNSLKNLMIPNSLVTIAQGSFSSNALTTVAIPNSVTSIGTHAFASNEIWKVDVPASVTAIGDGAFASNAMTRVTIPNSVTSIGTSAFEANMLSSVDLPDALTAVSDNAFGSNSLTAVTIPSSVSVIGASAFASNALRTVEIPDSVTTVGDGAFAFNQLGGLQIPRSVTEIGDLAFYENNLTRIVIPDSVASIGRGAFLLNSLRSVVIPDSVTTIEPDSFGWNALTHVDIPHSVTSIGDKAFDHNPLTSVVIPVSVRKIGDAAFRAPLVIFRGDAPIIKEFAPGQNWYGSFGDSASTTLYISPDAAGFTTPLWNGYSTVVGDPEIPTPPAPSISFTDISGHVFQSEITWMANNGISRGWQVGPSTYEFRPQNQILRGEMAAFLYRLAGQPAYTPPVSSPFIDVPTTHVFYKEISWLASTGISKGWVTPNGTEFRAEWSTTREVMAAFLHRFEGSPAYAPSGASPFRDVQPGIVFYNEILWLAAQGISTGWDMGYGCRDYRPAQNVLRSEMAAFIYRMENGGTAPLTGNTCSPPRN
ncbi:hypothetical protein J2Y46_002661 [Microbacterium sp. BE35]|uniref:leucine-rich repeat domain-containing protein n=1 Tax=Microbacterium sp. BE35 TaxID=2817773 RepID=UPI00285C65C0|nr:leucine-rich repeat protein [Microbacterium sp. BE35]MDR7189835.1 hypothetical protein [Microbacterium sp. BE35]